MRKGILPLFGIALTMCIVAPHCFAQTAPVPTGQGTSDQQGQAKTIFSFKDEIGLTDDQEFKLKAMLYDEQTLLDADNNALRNLGAELNKMIENKEDMQAIKSKLEEMAKIQVDVSYLNIADARSVETILTPDQLDKWRAIQKRFASQPKT